MVRLENYATDIFPTKEAWVMTLVSKPNALSEIWTGSLKNIILTDQNLQKKWFYLLPHTEKMNL